MIENPSMSLEEVAWADFLIALRAYRDAEYTNRSPIDGERAYLLLFDELGPVPIIERADHAASIVLFLNRWRCHFPREESREAIEIWIHQHALALQALSDLSLLAGVTGREAEIDGLYDSLIALRRGNPRITTMGDACASKLLHQMVPPLFVMWDVKIKAGYGTYSAFLDEMSRFARRITEQRASSGGDPDVEAYLQSELGYPLRKPLAKYIDEFNWWRAWPRPASI